MKKLIILFLLLPSLLFSQVSPSKIERIADANTVFGSALSYGTYLEMQSNNKTYKIINVNGVAGTAKFTDLVLNTDYIEAGTVTSVSTAAANNGVTATWSMASPTPALTIGLGAITPTSVNGLTLTALATGFTVAGGTTSKTLTVPLDASVSGTNTGDQTNISGNAATVTTNANLTGPVTSTGNATAIANGAISNAMLANGAVANLSGTNTGDQTTITGNAGTVTTNANLTGPVTSTGNATAIANGAISNAMLANGAVANLSGTNTGDQTNITGNAATVTTNANLTGMVTSAGNATTVVTNANLTGDVTSVGNASTIANNAVTLAKFQTIATNSLLGRSTAATGNVEVLTVGGGLSLSAGTLATTQSSFRTQATAASTLTLVVGDAYAQQFTGSTASQIVKLPTTSVAAGGSYLIMNNSTVPITLQSSDGTAIRIIGPNSQVIATAIIATPTTPAHWNEVSSSYYFQNGFRTQATAGSTLTLVVDDSYTQEFTGSTAGQIIQLPTTSVGAGQQFLIINNSTSAVTINSSASNLVQVVPPSTNVVLTALSSTPTTAANWDAMTNRIGQASIVAATAGINTTETVVISGHKLAANRLRAGTVIRITLLGTCTASAARVSTFGLRIGTAGTTADVLVASAATSNSATTGTAIPFKAVFELIIRTTGAAATAHGYCTVSNTGITGISTNQSQIILPTFLTFDSTTEALIISGTYKTANATCTSTFQDAFIEIVYQ